MLDFFEVALLLGGCFLVNYVTADKKTNWIEGKYLISLGDLRISLITNQ